MQLLWFCVALVVIAINVILARGHYIGRWAENLKDKANQKEAPKDLIAMQSKALSPVKRAMNKHDYYKLAGRIAMNSLVVYIAGVISFGALVYFWTTWGDQGMLYDTCPGVSTPSISFFQIALAIISFGIFVSSSICAAKLVQKHGKSTTV